MSDDAKKIQVKTNASATSAPVYLDVDDDITSIIDKLESAVGKEVRLVLPKRAAVLQSIVNMRLLKRSAEAAGKQPVLVTTEAALLPLAGAVRLNVAKNIEAKAAIPAAPGMPAEPTPTPGKRADGTGPVNLTDGSDASDEEEALPTKVDYDKPIGDLATAHEADNPETIELEDEAEKQADTDKPKPAKAAKNSKVKVPNFDLFRNRLGLFIVALVALIILLFFALSVLPKATITLSTSATPVSANLSLNTSGTAKTLDEKGGTIPGFSKTMDQTGTQTFNATGQQNNGNKATGAVTLAEQVCGTVSPPNDVPAGTGISSNGLTFIAQNTTHFSASGTVNGSCITYPATKDTTITAQVGGSKYNLAAGSNFAAQGYSGVSGQNSKDLHDGTDNIITVVSQGDVDSAVNNFKSANADSFAKKFENQLGTQGYWVLVTTLKVGDAQTSASPAVGQQATSATASIKITYTVLCIQKSDLTTAIKDALNKQIDSSKQKVTDSDILAKTTISVDSQTSPITAALSIAVNAPAVPLVSESEVKKVAEGQKTGYINAQLTNIPGVKDVKVKLSPFWVSKVPKKASKITVVIEHASGNQ